MDISARNVKFREYIGGNNNTATTGAGNFDSLQDLIEMPVFAKIPLNEAPLLSVVNSDVKVFTSSNYEGRIALGNDTNMRNGGISAALLAGSLGTADVTATVADAQGNVWNLARVLDPSTYTPVFNALNKQVWALIQVKSDTLDGDAIGAIGSENVQATFVTREADNFTVQPINRNILLQLNAIHCLVSMPNSGINLNILNEGDVVFDPPQVGGSDIPTNQTTVSLTATQTNATYTVNASGVGYVKTGDDGDLGIDAADFNARESKQIFLNGVAQLKGIDVIYQSAVSFQFMGTVDQDDVFLVVS